jgi:outer membrane PBP1 activator LpoA protein
MYSRITLSHFRFLIQKQLELRLTIRMLAGCVLLVLAACSSFPVDEVSPPDSGDIPRVVDADEDMLQLLLAQGAAAASPQREILLYQAALLLNSLDQGADAILLLETLDTETLPLELAADILFLQARLLADADQADAALQLLNSDRLTQLPRLPQNMQMSIYLFRGELYSGTGDYLASAQARIQADKLLPLRLVPVNHEQIWNALTALDATSLNALAGAERRFEFQGWYELGLVGKAYQYNLDRQVVELNRWRETWSRHPAAVYMPQAMQLVETMAEERPARLALLLPLNTLPGTVIRDGFMSAYYDVLQIGGRVPEVRLYNTSNTADIMALYQEAVADGAQMIIGPLQKPMVARLHAERSLPVPTLALNNVEASSPLSDSLYQFALSPENEALQIANRAWKDGHRLAAILSPAVSADDLYQRKRASFIDHWLSLGGQIVAMEEYRDDYTGITEALLDIDDSEVRKERLSELIQEEVEFVLRRRRDIDFIFLIAEPGPARQINPTLAYLYAGDIPVYASQDVYSGISNPLVDNDLNGILFGDSPWLLGFNDELKARTANLFPQNNALTLRLQAFGVDAYRLYPRLKQLSEVPDSQIYGATGLLRLGENRNIIRELSWARVMQGLAVTEAGDNPP